jgi:hypothetical protein
MQLPLTADLLVPLAAGAMIAAALVVLWVWLRRQRTATADELDEAERTITDQPSAQPVAPAEHTDGSGGSPSTPPPASSFAAVPAHWSGGSRPPGAAPAPQQDVSDQEDPPQLPRMAPAPAGPPTGPVPVAPWTRAEEQVAEPRYDGVPPAADNAGSSRSVAAAVAQAFATRAAAARAAAGLPAQPPPDRPLVAEPGRLEAEPPTEEPPPARGDVRDRLLAVLLLDPATAVDATHELDACLARLDHLSHAVRQEREVLRGVLQRLADSGLRTDQMARLAGIRVEELQALMAPVSWH